MGAPPSAPFILVILAVIIHCSRTRKEDFLPFRHSAAVLSSSPKTHTGCTPSSPRDESLSQISQAPWQKTPLRKHQHFRCGRNLQVKTTEHPLYRGPGGPDIVPIDRIADMALRPLLEISPHTTVNPTTTTQVNATEVEPSEVHPSVRFNSAVQEISPESTTSRGSFSKHSHHIDHVALGVSEVTPDDIRALSQSLKSCPLQERRLGIFSYEPYSLPVSRVSTLYLSSATHYS